MTDYLAERVSVCGMRMLRYCLIEIILVKEGKKMIYQKSA